MKSGKVTPPKPWPHRTMPKPKQEPNESETIDRSLIDKLTKQYDGFYADRDWDIDSESVSSMVKYVLYQASRVLGRQPSDILDVGCGKGHFSHAFTVNSEAFVTGIDLSVHAVSQAIDLYASDDTVMWFKHGNVLDGIAQFHLSKYDLIYIRAFSLFNKKHSTDEQIHGFLDHISKLMSDHSVMIIDEWTDFSGEIKPDGYYKGWHQRTNDEIHSCFTDYTPIHCVETRLELYPLWNNIQMGYLVIYERKA